VEAVALISCVSMSHHKNKQLVFRATSPTLILFEIVTGDETLCFQYDLEATDKVSNGNSQHLHDPRKLACQNHR
jgi:hypothetical protein